MSGLFTTLGSIAQALNADSQALAITSSNISNVNNQSYSRQQVNFANGADIATGSGVENLGLRVSVQSTANAVLNQQVMNEAGSTASAQKQQDLLQQAQAALGESITNASSTSSSTSATDTGLSTALGNLLGSFQALAASPTDNGTKQTVLEQAASLVDLFQSTDSNLAQVQAGADAGVASDVSSANTLLTTIAGLNTQIASAEAASPGSSNSLQNDRETALEQLAAIIPVTVTGQANGEDLVTTPSASGAAVTLVQNGTVPGPLAYSAGVLTGGAASDTLAPAGGSIQGAITASTGPIQDMRSSLDALAGQVVTAVNTIYNPSGAASGNFFTAGGTTAATIALNPLLTSSTLSAGPGGSGDNSTAVALSALSSTTFSKASGDLIDGTLTGALSTGVSALGNAVSAATNTLTEQTQIQTMVQNQRASISGVNMNQEMANLVQYQQAYQASSQVFGIVNQMLNSLIQSMGA